MQPIQHNITSQQVSKQIKRYSKK